MSIVVYTPGHYRVIFREGTKWTVEGTRIFGEPGVPIGLHNIEQRFEMTNLTLVASLFRLNGGRAGYYLANLRDRKYYYCGSNLKEVRKKLLELGVDQEDPRKKQYVQPERESCQNL